MLKIDAIHVASEIRVMTGVSEELHHRFGIDHVTMQVKIDTDHPCILAPANVV
jgi:hypothetical protein